VNEATREQSSQSGTAASRAEAKAHAKREFEKWALTYDRSALNELVFFPSVRACQEEIYRWLSVRGERPFRMLDVGCGTGTLLSIMAREPLAETLIGLDYAEEMVRRASAKFAGSDAPHKLQALRGDSERLPLADGSVDVVTCCNSFHHYPHQPVAVSEFRRVLRPGGLLVLIDGFRDNVIGWLVFDLGVASFERDVHHAPWSAVRDMIEQAGFASLRQRKMNVFAPLLVSIATA